MKRKIHKDIGAAKARVQETRAAYLRAVKAYNKHLTRELSKNPVDGEIFPIVQLKKSRGNKKR